MRKILLLAANPTSTRLRLDQEIRDIREGLERSRNRHEFEFVQRVAVRPRDIQRALLDEMPQIVHFSGHGEGEAGLFFEDNVGNAKCVSNAALASLFELFAQKAKIECVVLNGCYSQRQAEAVSEYMPYVVGIKYVVSEPAAIEFAVGFYDALGSGESVEFAFESGKVAMALSTLGVEDMPILLVGKTRLTQNPECLDVDSTDIGSTVPSPTVPSFRSSSSEQYQSNTVSGVTFAGANSNFNFSPVQHQEASVNVTPTFAQTQSQYENVQEVVEALSQLKQAIVDNREIDLRVKESALSQVIKLEKEIKKDELDRSSVEQTIKILKMRLEGVLTLAEPTMKVTALATKVWGIPLP